MKKFLALILSDVVFIMLINVKMPTIVGILSFMSKINFVLSWVEHGHSFITLEAGQQMVMTINTCNDVWEIVSYKMCVLYADLLSF